MLFNMYIVFVYMQYIYIYNVYIYMHMHLMILFPALNLHNVNIQDSVNVQI